MPQQVSIGSLTITDVTDGLHARLSSESHAVPAGQNGDYGDFTGCVTTMFVMMGRTDDSDNWTYTAAPTVGVQGVLVGRTYTVSSMSTDVGYVDLTASRVGYPSLTSRFSIAKAKSGPAGAVISLISSKQGFSFKDGVAEPANQTIAFTVFRHNTTEPVVFSASGGVSLVTDGSRLTLMNYTLGVPGVGYGDTAYLDLDQFGDNRQVTVTATCGELTASHTVVRLDQSTAQAGATVGADDSNYTGGRGNNLLRNSMLKDSTAGWGYALGPGCVLGEFRTVLNENGAPKGYGAIKLGFSGTASSAYESQVYCVDLAVPCIPGERMELGAHVGVYRGDAQLTASFLLSDGSFMLYVPVTGGVVEATSQSAWTQNLSDLQHLWGFVTAPANAVKCYMEVRVKRTTTAAPTDLYIALPYIGKAGAAQAVYSPWNQGAFITPSEVSTWIANAALGNAQIGGNLWSTNWNYAGGTGWLLDRSGNFYGNNIYARGDIEASSLKANTAMVGTLNIAGNAVSVPVAVDYPSNYLFTDYVTGVERYAVLLSATLTVADYCKAAIVIGSNAALNNEWHALSAGAGRRGHYNFPVGTEWAAIGVYRNGTWLTNIAQWNVGWGGRGIGSHMDDTGGYVKDCVFIDSYTTFIDLVPGVNNISITARVIMADGDICIRRNYYTYMTITAYQR